jgi:RNA polymerase sigma factor (sigma-70 family)
MSDDNPHPPPASTHCQLFKAEIYCLLQAESPRARSLLSYIRRTLRQYGLAGTYAESDIFNEAYIRGITYILKGGEIRSPKAWMRTTAFHIISEWSRYAKRYRSLDYGCTEIPSAEEKAIDLDIRTVYAALRKLAPEDRRIIRLKAVEGLSWKEVQQQLVEMGEHHQTEEALRKRGQRAMQKLRDLFHAQHPFKERVSQQK